MAGYYSLTVGQIDTIEAPERVRRGMGPYPIPLVILARLAVDLDYQKHGRKTTDYWYPEHERNLLWCDPIVGIQWPVGGQTGSQGCSRKGIGRS